MKFLCVNQTVRANIFGQIYHLSPLDQRRQNINDILVTDNFSASELLARHPDVLLNINVSMDKGMRFPRLVNRVSDIRSGDKVLILRNGGTGDHILFLPALDVFRRHFPADAEIWLASQKEKHPLFAGNRNLDRLIPLPVRLDELMKADCLIDFSSRKVILIIKR